MSDTRNFDISDVLSVTHSRLVSTRHMDGIWDILNFMNGEDLFTHALTRAAAVCRPALLAQFPELTKESAEHVGPTNWEPWLQEMRAKYGNTLPVAPLAKWESKDPLAELLALPGPPI